MNFVLRIFFWLVRVRNLKDKYSVMVESFTKKGLILFDNKSIQRQDRRSIQQGKKDMSTFYRKGVENEENRAVHRSDFCF